MKPCLLDVNVLLALAWPHHAHHPTVTLDHSLVTLHPNVAELVG